MQKPLSRDDEKFIRWYLLGLSGWFGMSADPHATLLSGLKRLVKWLEEAKDVA